MSKLSKLQCLETNISTHSMNYKSFSIVSLRPQNIINKISNKQNQDIQLTKLVSSMSEVASLVDLLCSLLILSSVVSFTLSSLSEPGLVMTN